MKKIFAFAFIIMLCALLSGCTDTNNTPDGMQLVGGGADEDYCFFAPEEWTVSNLGDIDAVYVSTVDTTSVTFTEIDPSSFVKADPAKSDEEYFLNDYFNDMKSEFPADTVFGTMGENTLLGTDDLKADKAVKYTYSYTYSGYKFGFMQIFASNNGRFYIFTYSSPLAEKMEGVTNYDYYIEKIVTVIDNFRFFDNAPKNEEKPEYLKDGDGFILISDKKLAGFEMYVPETFKHDYSSAIVSATHSDGSNVTLTKTTAGGMLVNEYFELRKKELSNVVSDFTDVKVINKTQLGNSKNAAAYEYTYVYNGKAFHVYQIFAVVGNNGYVFTYTASEDNYAMHFSDVEKIISKVNFR